MERNAAVAAIEVIPRGGPIHRVELSMGTSGTRQERNSLNQAAKFLKTRMLVMVAQDLWPNEGGERD